MTSETAGATSAGSAAADARATRGVLAIAIGSGLASLSMNFWIPFVPLFMKELGATSDANALFWTGMATGSMGVARLVAGPFWGILSDRYGRRAMFLRALYCASITMAVAAMATEPWHLAAAFALQGLFSGFIPAATALTSVTVPDRRLNSSLSMVTGAQYLGNTIGPAVGAVMAAYIGYRGAIIGGAILPAIAGVYATFAVPKDRVGASTPRAAEASAAPRKSESILSLLTVQFMLVLAVWFFSLAFGQLLRTAMPIALEQIGGIERAAAYSGVAFTLSGLGGIVGLLLARRFVRPGLLQLTLIVASIAVGLCHLVLPLSANIVIFMGALTLIALLQAVMVPAINTLIATNAPRERRGTAVGVASAVQAVAFMVGPMAAAGFAAYSLNLGFVVLGVLSIVLGIVVRIGVREPDLEAAERA